MPEGPAEWFVPMEKLLTKQAKCRFRTLNGSRSKFAKRITFFWNLLQCKTLAAVVPKDFILEAYVKHSRQMKSIPEGISDVLTEKIQQFIEPFITKTVECYRNVTKMPKAHATNQSKRSEGGMKNDLRNQILTTKHLQEYNRIRIDPVVIHLEGPPGVGKSYSVETICKLICERFGYNPEDFRNWTFYRSAGVKHWDGYNSQLITVIDDIGFEFPYNTGPQTSVSELIQLCSDCDYVLPMAKLSEKGTKFTSKFLVITSNKLSQLSRSRDQFSDPLAFLRRIAPVYRTVGAHKDISFDEFHIRGTNDTDMRNVSQSMIEFSKINSNLCLKQIVNKAIEAFERKMSRHREEKFLYQEIQQESPEDSQVLLRVPKHHPVINEAVACAIAEPLKVRMITKTDPASYGLKPLQLAMFDALKTWKCFEPCWNPDYDLTQLGTIDPNKYFLSGDYTAATDELNYNVSQLVIEALANAFAQEPYLADLIRWEGGQHLISYPGWTEIPSVIQSNGQLMGSLLSFPILCILNAFTVCEATQKSLDDVPALLHGDDVAAQFSNDEIVAWKGVARDIGLQLSVGKNYVSKDYVSIDSQLFVKSVNPSTRQPEMVKMITGKFRLAKQENGTTTFRDALKNGFTKKQICKYSSSALKSTYQSLDVSFELGGLGLETDSSRELNIYDRAIYCVLRGSKTRVTKMSDNIYSVLEETARILQLDRINTILEEHEIPTPSLTKKVRNMIRCAYRSHAKNPERQAADQRKLGLICDISTPLSKYKRVIVHCANHSQESLQEIQNKFVFNRFCLSRSSQRVKLLNLPNLRTQQTTRKPVSSFLTGRARR
jgi:hypothetical protein